MTNIKSLTILAAIFFSGLANAATFEVRYPIAATTSFAAPVVPPVVPPTEPTKPVVPEEPKFDLSPWQNINFKSSRAIAANQSFLSYSTSSNEITSKNNDVQNISIGPSSTNELIIGLIDPSQQRDWSEFKKNAKSIKIEFLNNPLTITCQISSFGNAATAKGQGISTGCTKLTIMPNFNEHTNSEGKVELRVGFY
ncbi:hypothetical protein [Pseudomonas sp. MF6747]|uniref:hypothetical protein n=1 Tax=Pseudomonas sp. MF6747 TaxID=2797527 RepID=UPI0019099F21|nr:hypothetical protein [Pseudomonas sp. MF6747]MBK3506621.1 hypothetical protein [Pseudomonas sp. MF6747]